MLIYREEHWGRTALDRKDDEFWAELRPGAQVPRIDLPLSALCWLGCSSLSPRSRRKRPLPGVAGWLPILDRLRDTGFLRLNFAGCESTPRVDLHEIVMAGLDKGMAIVVSAADCTPDLEKCLGLPAGASLQILFDPARAWRTERSGRLSLARRLEVIHQCVLTGVELRVLTPYDPFSPMTLVELGEELALAGIQEWLIFPRPARNARGLGTDAALAEIQALREAFPYIEIRYGSFLERELDFVVRPDGRVRARGGGRVGPALPGTIDQLRRGWLSEAFLDRHVDLWVSGTSELCEICRAETDPGHHVFISYNRQDRAPVLALRDRLEAAGVRAWLDDSLEVGDRWQGTVAEALEGSPTILICIGPCGLGPFQEKIEVPAALELMVRRDARVIPVLLPGVQDAAVIPLLLRNCQYLDLRSAEDQLRRLIQVIFPREAVGQGQRPHREESPAPL